MKRVVKNTQETMTVSLEKRIWEGSRNIILTFSKGLKKCLADAESVWWCGLVGDGKAGVGWPSSEASAKGGKESKFRDSQQTEGLNSQVTTCTTSLGQGERGSKREREREIFILSWLQVRITGPRHHLTSSL